MPPLPPNLRAGDSAGRRRPPRDTLKLELAIDSAAVDRLSFRLFALSTDASHTRLAASVYSSDSGAWTHSVETLALVFSIIGDVPRNEERYYEYDCRYLFMTKDGLLSAVMLHEYEYSIQFWVLETPLGSDAKWVLRKTVLLDSPLPRELHFHWLVLRIVWFEEEDNVIFVWTANGIAMFNLDSMKCIKLSEEIHYNKVDPYSSFMTAGRDAGLLFVDEEHG